MLYTSDSLNDKEIISTKLNENSSPILGNRWPVSGYFESQTREEFFEAMELKINTSGITALNRIPDTESDSQFCQEEGAAN